MVFAGHYVIDQFSLLNLYLKKENNKEGFKSVVSA